ncbi:MAG: aspartate aminotransferase family protein [Candidatus Thermoplasmatota archaeon]|nr:aspartate aminotransferase family protein [Candidatus Thermoplasmatota archaeon]
MPNKTRDKETRNKGRTGDMRTPAQRYTSMARYSSAVYARAANLLPGGVESNFRHMDPFPFYAARAEGNRIYDVDGNEYMDFLLSQGAILFGHRKRQIEEAVSGQLRKGANTAIPTELCATVAEKISSYVPSVRLLRFANSGTEATMHALRTARGFTGKDKIAKAEGGYHGVHDYVLWSIWAPKMRGTEKRPKATPISKGIPKAISKTVVVFPFNDIEATYDILHKERDNLAAVITEPVLANVGCLVPRDNYLKELQKICNELGILLILDEVITGFRLARGGAQEIYGVKPDLTTFGKALGGGFQMAAFGGRKDVMTDLLSSDDSWPPKKWPTQTYHAGTFNAHPVSLAASAAVMSLIADDRVYSHLKKISGMLFSGLQQLIDDRRMTAHVASCGSMGHIYFGADEVRTARAAIKTRWDVLGMWGMECLVRGMLFGHPKGEKMFVSTAHVPEDIEKALEVADCGFDAVGT